MSKQRQRARAEREAAQAQLAAERQEQRARLAARAAKARRREQTWRQLRWWQHGAGFRRDKEKWAALAIIVLVSLLVTYLLTSSAKAVLAVALVCAVAAPALAAILFDRRSR
jgi:Flp pilus assembly protein TadB